MGEWMIVVLQWIILEGYVLIYLGFEKTILNRA
jgi:hypothetical protein